MKRHYPNFDWLRLALALSVVFVHAWNATGENINGLWPAVPAFLALSGFLVLKSYEDSRSAGHFFWKRLLRVGPAFVASLVLVAVVFGGAFVLPTLHNWYTAGLLPDAGRNPVLWTLSCEEVLYVALVVFYVLGFYKRPALVWIALVVSLTLPILVWGDNGTRARSIACLPSAFLIGNLFYLYRDKIQASYLPLVSTVVILALFPLRGSSFAFQFVHQSLLVVSLVWLGIAAPALPRIKLDISYGVYLYHAIVVGALWGTGMRERWPLLFVAFGATIAIALLSALSIEQPALKYKNSPLRSRRTQRAEVVELAA